MQGEDLKLLVMGVLKDVRVKAVEVLDVRTMTDVTDYMVIATCNSTRQVKALADEVVMQVKRVSNQPIGVEGQNIGEWALIDLGDVVTHVMTSRTCAVYNLGQLWSIPKIRK